MQIVIFRFKPEVTAQRQDEIIEPLGQCPEVKDSIAEFTSKSRKCWLLVEGRR